MKKPFLAMLATLSLTVVGLVSGVAPANAVYNMDDSLRNIEITRSGGAAIVGTNIVASTTLGANESLNSYRYRASFASVGAPLTVPVGAVLADTIAAVNSATSVALNGFDSDINVQWTKTDNTSGSWYSYSQGSMPTGEFSAFVVAGSQYLFGNTVASVTVTTSVTLNGTALTPLTLVALDPGMGYQQAGFSFQWQGGNSYTPSSADSQYVSYSEACFWPADFTLAADSVLKVSYQNADQLTNTSFASNNYVRASGNSGSGMGSYWNESGVESGEVFSISLSTLPSAMQAVRVTADARVENPTANEIRPVFKAWLESDLTETNILDTCSRFESFAAPVLTPTTSTTATLTWTAPVTTHSSGWDEVSVYACLVTNTNCGTDFKDTWDLGPNDSASYDFSYMGMNQIVGEQATISASTMMDAGMMFMGPQSGPSAQWSPSTEYKYFVSYRNGNTNAGYKGLSLVSAAITAGGVESPAVEEEIAAPAAVVSIPTPIKNFAPHKVGAVSEKSFALDGSGLATGASITVNGKKLAFTKDAAGKIQIELPKGLKRGASYNLVVSDANGSFTLLDAIVVSKDLPLAKKVLPSFNGRATSMNATQVREIRALVAASNFGDTVTCTAYFGGAVSEAIAKARATSACATATAANPALTAVIRTADAIASSRNKVRVVIG